MYFMSEAILVNRSTVGESGQYSGAADICIIQYYG